MGICYSSSSNRRKTGWENGNDSGGRLDSKSKKNISGALVRKFSGGGASAAAALVSAERALFQIPGRLFSSGATQIASLYTQQGKKGTNQDAMIIWENFCTGSNADATFCGVFDGHGPYGHMVARKVRDALPILLSTQWDTKSESNPNSARKNGYPEGMVRFDDFMDDDGCESLEAEENEKIPEMHIPLKKSILKAFKLMDKELKLHPTIDCFCSGSTAVVLIMQGQDLVIGNVGDSRAVLATRDKDNGLVALQLTVDLKPNLPREFARIQRCKGRVFALQDEPEVARVWLPNSDSPGLAMARAFGDFCLKDFGLISMPDVYHHHITERDEFVILATDGVWDVLSNKEAADIVASAPSRGTAARALVDCATRAWKLKYPTSKNDDCAVVCLFLEHVPAASTPKEQNDFPGTPEEETNTVLTIMESGISDTDATTSSAIFAEPPDTTKESSEIVPAASTPKEENDFPGTPEEETDTVLTIMESGISDTDATTSHAIFAEPTDTTKESSEIVPVIEEAELKRPDKTVGQSKRSLAECLSTAEDEEWSALEGFSRANSLLSLPRFLPFDKRSTSWRKWL